MNLSLRFLAVAALSAALTLPQVAVADAADLVRAQRILVGVGKVLDKYDDVQRLLDSGEIELNVAEPKAGSTGKFMLPFDDEGVLTPWAEKALSASAGSAVGATAGGKAAEALAAKVPIGGLAGGLMKRKSKETGAVLAIGGWDYIKSNTAASFNKLQDYSVYLHSQYNGTPDYEQALAAAMAIYPKLATSHQKSVDRAYKDARKRAKKLRKQKK